MKSVTDFFKKLAPIGTYSIDPNLEKEIGLFKTDMERARYLVSFVDMAKRGLYSFDIDTYLTAGLAYFRVARPVRPLRFDSLPDDIRKIVGRTRLKGVRFEDDARIDYQSTLIV